MIRVVTPVPLLEIIDLYKRGDALNKPLRVRAALLQAARSESIGFYKSDALIAAALLYPTPTENAGEDLRELVFMCVAEARHHMLAIVRAAQAARHSMSGSVRIRALCRRDNIAGRRLTWLCGLRPRGRTGVWKWYEWPARTGE